MQRSVDHDPVGTTADAKVVETDSQTGCAELPAGRAVSNKATFPQFCRLPPELRARIWECTWTEARVIEVASREPDGSDESDSDTSYVEYAYLRPTSRLSTWLEHDFGSRDMSAEPFETFPKPVAPRTCHESRILFLQKHRLIQHPKLATAAFYLNPRSDLLCLLYDVNKEDIEEVQTYYGAQLGAFQTILVEEIGWGEDLQRLVALLPNFTGLMAVTFLLESYEFGSGEDAPTTEEEYQRGAVEMRDRDTPFISGRGWTIQYVDRRLNVYAELDQ